MIEYNKIKEYINGDNGNGCTLLLNEQEFEFEKSIQNKSNTKVSLKIKCKCSNEFKAPLDKFKNQNKKQCNECGLDIKRKRFAKTQQQFEDEIKKLVGDEYTVIGKYINTDMSIDIRHNSETCNNYIWNARPNLILRGGRCPICSYINNGIKCRKTHEQFCKEVREVSQSNFTILSKYQGAFENIVVKHNICGHVFKTSARSMLKNRGCPHCNFSKGERNIYDYFKANKINFIQQYEYAELVGMGSYPLKFDFAVFEDSNLKFLLEYDGEYHYLPILGQLALDKQQEHDRRKDEYCKLHNIDLLRIPYWDFDIIEEIIDEKIAIK